MIRDPWLKGLVIVMSAIAGIYLVGLIWQVAQQFADIILLFFLAWMLAFILEPLVGLLVLRGRMPRLAAIALTYVTLLVLVAIGGVLFVPVLTNQLVEFARNLPDYGEQLATWAAEVQASVNGWLLARHIPGLVDVGSAFDSPDLARRVQEASPGLLTNVVGVATGAATLVFATFVVVILSFYFMVDGARIAEGLILALPPRAQDDLRFLMANVHRAFAGFLRGQVIQAVVGGIGTGVVMAALGVDYALLSSVVAALVLLIPFLGPIAAVLLPIVITLLTRPEVTPVLVLLLLGLQQVLFHVLAPRIMSQQVGLNPLLVFFAVFAGARIAGVWGAVFGVPVVAVLANMTSFYRANQDERAARLQEELPGQELVSVEMPSPAPPAAGSRSRSRKAAGP